MKKSEQKKKSPETPKRSGTFDKAVVDYEKAMKHFHKRAWEEAERGFEEVLAKHGVEIAICERAAAHLRICKEQQGHAKPRAKSADEHYLLGILELNSGDPDKAIHELEKVLEGNPKDDRAHYAMAAAYARLGKEEQALGALKEAIGRSRESLYLAQRDPDFESLQDSPDFALLTHDAS